MKQTEQIETLGERLRRAMRRTKVGNEALAKRAGVHPTTISKWLSDKQKPDAEPLERAAMSLGVTSQYLRHGATHPRDVTAAAGGVGSQEYGDVLAPPRTSVVIPEQIPQSARALIRRFEAEATELGASEQEVEYIRRILTMPETYGLYGTDVPRVLVGLDALMRGLRAWLVEVHGHSR